MIDWKKEIDGAKSSCPESGFKYLDLAEQILEERNQCVDKLLKTYHEIHEELCELRCAVSAFTEVLESGIPAKEILKTEGGEEELALLISRDDVQSVLDRYGVVYK